MNRRRIAAVSLAAAAVVGTAGPSWAFWTMTSDPTSTGGAKANTLNTPTVQSSRTGNGSSLVASFKVVTTSGAVPDKFTVFRSSNGTTFDPVPGCVDISTTTTCQSMGSDNNGDKTYRVTVTAGTFWTAPSYAVCQYLNNSPTPTGPQNFQCSPLTNPIAPASASRSVAPADGTTSTSKSAPAPTPTPTPTPTPVPTPEPTPEPAIEEPAPAEAPPAEQTTEPATGEEPKATEPAPKPGEQIGAEMGAGAPEPAASSESSSTEQSSETTTEGSTAPAP